MSLIPASFLNCVVAIGVPPDAETPETGPAWIGSGFFYGRQVAGSDRYWVYLVSNRHVFGELEQVLVRANPPAADPAPAKDYLAILRHEGNATWFGHPDESIDVATLSVNFELLRSEGMEVSFFEDDKNALTKSQIAQSGVTEGDFIYVLGYPMALVGDHRSVVIVRSGSIARIRDSLAGIESTFLIDSSVFPGNSGGPVLIRPEAVAITGTQAPNRAALIGIVSGYLSYSDVAVSAQTGRVLMIAEENSGLASAFPVDAINECIDQDPKIAQQQVNLGESAPGDVGNSPVDHPPET